MTLSPDKFFKARITLREDFSEDLLKLRVNPEGDFRFVAGQYATVGVHGKGKLIERAYSIVSSPYEEEVEFFIELVPQGELTPLLHKLRKGDELSFRKVAKGRFTLDLKSGRQNHLLVSTVTGVAPFVSYVRTLHQDWKKGAMPADLKLFVLQGASRSWEFGYQDELAKAAAVVPWLKYVTTVSRPWENMAWTGETGRVEDIMRKYMDQWGLSGTNATAYLCGHPQMIENGAGILTRAGWDKRTLQTEAYFQPVKKTAS
jgi:ferredoxin/flavodoxin---NADP+ reductase